MEKAFLAWGILFGMPGVCIDIGTSFMAIANILIFSVIAYKGIVQIKHRSVYWDRKYALWYALLISIIITSAVSFITLPDSWFYGAISRTIKIVIIIVSLMLLWTQKQLLVLRERFIRGLYYSAVINMLWAWLQMYCGYILGININRLVFQDILHLSSNVYWDQSVAHDIVYRMSGLSWEPASFGLIACIGYILTKNNIVKMLFAITILLSTSKSGIICLAILFIRDIWSFIVNKKNIVSSMINQKGIIVFLIVLVSTGLIWLEYDNYIMNALENIAFIFDLIITSIVSPQDNFSSNIHSTYYIELWNVLSSVDFVNFLFGTGMFSSGYIYEVKRIVIMQGVWIPESDFITIVVGNGVVGGILYYSILIKNIMLRENYINTSLSILLFVFGFFYGQCTGWIVMVFLLSLCEGRFREKKTAISVCNTAKL